MIRFMSAGDCLTISTATSNTMAACCRSAAQEYEELVEPCVQMIHEGKDEEAYQLYRAYTIGLGEEYMS